MLGLRKQLTGIWLTAIGGKGIWSNHRRGSVIKSLQIKKNILFILYWICLCELGHIIKLISTKRSGSSWKTEIIFHLHTNEPQNLPAHRKKYGFDNRGFRAGAKNEITKRMRCGKYRVFVRDIPEEYNVTAVTVGFNTGGIIQWTRCFRLAKQKWAGE